MSNEPTYSLALSDGEVERYRFMAKIARETEATEWRVAGLEPGARVADIGCGPGLVLVELADVVGPSGRVVGIDRGDAEVETASRLIAERDLKHASVHRAEAWDTGIEPASIDVVNIRHVLAHNTTADQRRILEHALDLLRPGGSLYAVDVDLSMFQADPDDPDLRDLNERYRVHLVDAGRDPSVGPKLGSLAASVGFRDVQRFAHFTIPPPAVLAEVRPPPWAARQAMLDSGHATDGDVARWDRALTAFAQTAVAQNRAVFLATFRIIARKPG
jgi:SAM-dependent methyltransferase